MDKGTGVAPIIWRRTTHASVHAYIHTIIYDRQTANLWMSRDSQLSNMSHQLEESAQLLSVQWYATDQFQSCIFIKKSWTPTPTKNLNILGGLPAPRASPRGLNGTPHIMGEGPGCPFGVPSGVSGGPGAQDIQTFV